MTGKIDYRRGHGNGNSAGRSDQRRVYAAIVAGDAEVAGSAMRALIYLALDDTSRSMA